jgi:hypothetical protein
MRGFGVERLLAAAFTEKHKSWRARCKPGQSDIDSFKTPRYITKLVKDKLRLKGSEIFDGCPIALDWREFAHYDCLAQDLPMRSCTSTYHSVRQPTG